MIYDIKCLPRHFYSFLQKDISFNFGILMGTHCTPAIADLFICVYRYIYLDFYPKLKIKPSRYSSTITIDI